MDGFYRNEAESLLIVMISYYIWLVMDGFYINEAIFLLIVISYDIWLVMDSFYSFRFKF